MMRFRRLNFVLAVAWSLSGSVLGHAAIALEPGSGRALLPRRISSQVMDLGKAYPIYMVAGMATLIVLPAPVTGIRTGNPGSIRYFRPDKPENEVTLILQNQRAKPTNLILRSGQKIYVESVRS